MKDVKFRCFSLTILELFYVIYCHAIRKYSHCFDVVGAVGAVVDLALPINAGSWLVFTQHGQKMIDYNGPTAAPNTYKKYITKQMKHLQKINARKRLQIRWEIVWDNISFPLMLT